MLPFFQAHWNVIAAVAGGVVLLAWLFWPSISKWHWPGKGTTEDGTTVKSDLDSLLGILSRAKKRAGISPLLVSQGAEPGTASNPQARATADALGFSVEAMVKELTA